MKKTFFSKILTILAVFTFVASAGKSWKTKNVIFAGLCPAPNMPTALRLECKLEGESKHYGFAAEFNKGTEQQKMALSLLLIALNSDKEITILADDVTNVIYNFYVRP